MQATILLIMPLLQRSFPFSAPSPITYSKREYPHSCDLNVKYNQMKLHSSQTGPLLQTLACLTSNMLARSIPKILEDEVQRRLGIGVHKVLALIQNLVRMLFKH